MNFPECFLTGGAACLTDEDLWCEFPPTAWGSHPGSPYDHSFLFGIEMAPSVSCRCGDACCYGSSSCLLLTLSEVL